MSLCYDIVDGAIRRELKPREFSCRCQPTRFTQGNSTCGRAPLRSLFWNLRLAHDLDPFFGFGLQMLGESRGCRGRRDHALADVPLRGFRGSEHRGGGAVQLLYDRARGVAAAAASGAISATNNNALALCSMTCFVRRPFFESSRPRVSENPGTRLPADPRGVPTRRTGSRRGPGRAA